VELESEIKKRGEVFFFCVSDHPTLIRYTSVVLGGSAVWVWAMVWAWEAVSWVWVLYAPAVGPAVNLVMADGAPVVRIPLPPVFAADEADVVKDPLAVPAVALLCLM
jgi:hypothetical protein